MTPELEKAIAIALASRNDDASVAAELIKIIKDLQAKVIDLQTQIDNLP